MGARQVAPLVVFLALGACAPGETRTGAQRLFVSAAVSVSEPLQAAADEYERANAAMIVLNVGGSDTLATQLVAGARADLFLSADDRQMNRVEAAGRILTATRVDLLTNQLAVVAPVDATRSVSGIDGLTEPWVRRVAMGDPDAVPAGVYAREYLQSIGLWDTVRSKVIPTRNVRAALAAVDAGHADLGIVYRTDIAAVVEVKYRLTPL